MPAHAGSTRSRRRWSRLLIWPLAAVLLCMIVAWPVSYRRGPIWAGGPDGAGFSYLFYVLDGDIAFVRREAPFQISGWGIAVSPSAVEWRWLPTIMRKTTAGAGRILSVHIPIWMPVVVTASATVVTWRRSRRPLPGHCRNCGYDLAGVVAPVCPECGGAREGGPAA